MSRGNHAPEMTCSTAAACLSHQDCRGLQKEASPFLPGETREGTEFDEGHFKSLVPQGPSPSVRECLSMGRPGCEGGFNPGTKLISNTS